MIILNQENSVEKALKYKNEQETISQIYFFWVLTGVYTQFIISAVPVKIKNPSCCFPGQPNVSQTKAFKSKTYSKWTYWVWTHKK